MLRECFETPTHVNLVMEHVGGDAQSLYSDLKAQAQRRFPEDKVKAILR